MTFSRWRSGGLVLTLLAALAAVSGGGSPAAASPYDQVVTTVVMRSGVPSDRPMAKAQGSLTYAAYAGYALGAEVRLVSAEISGGFFRFQQIGTGLCLGLPDARGQLTRWVECAGGHAKSFYVTPSLRAGGYFIKPYAQDDACLFDDPQSSVTQWRPIYQTCADGQDGHDALTTNSSANAKASAMTWNMFPVDGSGTHLLENMNVPTTRFMDQAQFNNTVQMCNWGAFVAYFVFDYNSTDENGKVSAGHYKSGNVLVGRCVETQVPAGFLAGTVTPILQMEGVGHWAAMGATSIVGWDTDLTVHINGNLCNSYAWTTARSRNSAVAIDEYPGTDCWRDTTKGVETPFTWDEAKAYVLKMVPFIIPGDKSIASAPESLFSSLGKNLGAKLPVAGNNLYKNIYLIGWHANS